MSDKLSKYVTRKNAVLLIVALVLLIVVLAACGGGPKVPVAPGLPKVDIVGILDKANKFYNTGVDTYEKTGTQLWAAYTQKMNTFRTGARDLMGSYQLCFTNVAATESQIGIAVMSKVSQTGMINAFATQSSVSGEVATAKCAEGYGKLADYIISNRASIQDAYLAQFNNATDYMAYLTDWPEVQMMNDLLQTYGSTTGVYKALADRGIGVSDWSWLPTKNLWVSAGNDKNLCQYYISGQFMQNVPYSMKLKFTGHEDSLALLYESTWNPAANGGDGECRLTRFAALEYRTRSIVSQDTGDVLKSGKDTSLFPPATPVIPDK